MGDKNKRSSASFVPFKPLDNLFEPTVREKPAPSENGLTHLPIDDLIPFKDHPFSLYGEDKMAEMVESVQEHGVITPILVRPIKDGDGYEIISGHNRVEACRRAGIETIPATIRDLDDDTAIILMVDSNLKQREKLLPIEKAKAYKMKLEALKRQGARLDLTSGQVGQKLGTVTRDAIAEGAEDSSRQIHRYIRLTSLIPALQDAVNDGRLAFNPAVEVSYLEEADQEIVQEIMDRDQISPSLSQAQKLHRLAQIDKIDDSAIETVMTVEKPMYETITFRRNTVEKYFPAGTTGKEIEQTIIRLLEDYSKRREIKKTYDQER